MLIKTERTRFRRNIIVAAAIIALVRAYLGGLTFASLWAQPARLGLAVLAATITLLAVLGLRRVASLVFKSPWYGSMPAMLFLVVALKAIVRIVLYACQSACERLELPQTTAKGQMGLLAVALTLMWVVLLDRTNASRESQFKRRGRSALPSIRSRVNRYTLWHRIRGAKDK